MAHKRPTLDAREDVLSLLRQAPNVSGAAAPPPPPAPAAPPSKGTAGAVRRRSRSAGKPVGRQASKPVSRYVGKSTHVSREDRAKATFYLDPGDMTLLEGERLRRIQAGQARRGADLSALVREAIRGTFGRR